MNEFEVGGFVVAKAGHDTGKYYVIFQTDGEYVYLVDGRIRTIDRPKKKKKMHVQQLNDLEPILADKIRNKTVKNEEIKRVIKWLQSGKLVKEAR